MPVIQVQMLPGRSTDQKRALIAELASGAMRALAVPEDSIRILLSEVPPENWGVGSRSMAELRSGIPSDGPVTDEGSSRAVAAAARVDCPSPLAFAATLERLTGAITDAGMQIFAVIDHAGNASAAGLTMLPSVVLIYGKAAGGTPIMTASPASALDLPLRVLVHEDAESRTTVSFHPIAPVLTAAGVPDDLAHRLDPAQALLLEAIAQ